MNNGDDVGTVVIKNMHPPGVKRKKCNPGNTAQEKASPNEQVSSG